MKMKNNYGLKLIVIMFLTAWLIINIISDFVNPFTISSLSLKEKIKYEQMIF